MQGDLLFSKRGQSEIVQAKCVTGWLCLRLGFVRLEITALRSGSLALDFYFSSDRKNQAEYIFFRDRIFVIDFPSSLL